MSKTTWLFLLASAALAAVVWWSRSWWRPATTAPGVHPVQEAGPLPADTRLSAPADTPRAAPQRATSPPAFDAPAPEAAGEGAAVERIDRRAEIEEIYVRLDELRANYGALSRDEYERALTDVRTAHGKELELIYDERQASGQFDAVHVHEPGTTVDPPDVEGKSSTRVLSEPTADGKQRVSFIVVRHEAHSALVTLEKEMAWLSAQIARMDDR